MERHEFIKNLGIGVLAVCAGNCLSSCSKSDDNDKFAPPPAGTKISANLSSLVTVGSFTKVSNILFIRIAEGNSASSFKALQAVCTHENGELVYIASNNNLQCQKHAAKFALDGSVISGPLSGGTATAIKVYDITVTSTSLEVTIK